MLLLCLGGKIPFIGNVIDWGEVLIVDENIPWTEETISLNLRRYVIRNDTYLVLYEHSRNTSAFLYPRLVPWSVVGS